MQSTTEDMDHREQAGSDPVTFFGAKKTSIPYGGRDISMLFIKLGMEES